MEKREEKPTKLVLVAVQLLGVVEDLLDGQCTWHEIKAHTGLSDERCKEIERIGKKCLAGTIFD